jgi:hypothetical protein
MRTFLRVLLGDVWNVSVVVAIVLVEIAMTWGGVSFAAAFIVPPLTLGGVVLLMRR